MCMGGSVPKDNSAEIARQQVEQREAAIRAGRGRIDEAFSQFDDPYFQGQQEAFTSYYRPQIDDQYADARRALTLNLARTGNLQSGAGARRIGDLTQQYQDQLAQYGAKGVDFANQRRGDVESARNELYAQNAAAANPSAAASSAMARAGALAPSPGFSPIGTLFSDFANTAATAIQANRQRGGGATTFSPSNAVSVVR